MTTSERAVLSGELADFRNELLGELREMRKEMRSGQEQTNDRINVVNTRLDRQDGAFTFIKAGLGFLGVGGVGIVIAAILQASGHSL
jgi:hypothetical protein